MTSRYMTASVEPVHDMLAHQLPAEILLYASSANRACRLQRQVLVGANTHVSTSKHIPLFPTPYVSLSLK